MEIRKSELEDGCVRGTPKATDIATCPMCRAPLALAKEVGLEGGLNVSQEGDSLRTLTSVLSN